MEFEAFKSRLQQKRDETDSFVANKEIWKEAFSAEASELFDVIEDILKELVAASLVKVSAIQQPVLLSAGEDTDLFPVSGVQIEYESKSFFLLPELVNIGIGRKPELRFFGSKNRQSEGRNSHGLAYHDGKWYWTSANKLTQPLSKDTLAKVLMS